MASTSGIDAGSPRAHSSDASRRPRETCERAQGRLFSPRLGLSGERLLARDGEQAARRGSGRRRRDAESWEEDRVSTHYHARAAARASQGKHCGCPFGGTTLSLKQQRDVRPAPPHPGLTAGLPR